MPRITIARVVGLLPLAWLSLVGTWLFLPSPALAPTGAGHNAYAQRRLRAGAVVTTVHEDTGFFRHTSGPRGGVRPDCADCGGLALDWRLLERYDSDSILLHLGNARLNLTDAALRGVAAAAAADDGSTAEQTPYYLSDPVMATVRHGTTDDLIAMPWFRWTDRVLISEVLHGGVETIDIRLLVTAPGVVEIWKNIDLWNGFKDPSSIRDADREYGLLATFSNLPISQIFGGSVRSNADKVEVANFKGMLPSRTWPLRRLICGPLYVPTFALPMVVYFVVFRPIPLLFLALFTSLAVLVSWLRAGRPEFGPWVANLPVVRLCCRGRARRARRRGVWGPMGPVSDEESGLSDQKPGSSMFKSLNSLAKPTKSRPRLLQKY